MRNITQKKIRYIESKQLFFENFFMSIYPNKILKKVVNVVSVLLYFY